MKLRDLNPRYKDGVLLFDCPNKEHKHCIIRVPVNKDVYTPTGAWWIMVGTWPNVTLRNPDPKGKHSLDCGDCFHLTLTDGELK